MDQYSVRVSYSKQVVKSIVIAALSVLPMLLLGTMYGGLMPLWAQVLCVCILAGSAGMLAVYLRARSSAPAVVTVQDAGFKVDFLKKGFLQPVSFQMTKESVKSWETSGNDADGYYLSFTTGKRPASFNIDANSSAQGDVDSFHELIRHLTELLKETKS